MKQDAVNKTLEALKDQVYSMKFEHEQDRKTMLRNIMKIQQQKVNILIVGATGVGKSSTINALFDCEKAVIGRGVDPQTMHIEKYELDNITFYDSPGLGDGVEQDTRHAKGIIDLLHKLDSDGKPLIDLVLILLDGGSRDYGTAYRLLENVIIPSLDSDRHGRVLVGINQADMAMKGRGWDQDLNQPMPELERFLEQKVNSTKQRIKESTGVDMTPIYYSAGYKDEFGEQLPYNMAKLLSYIVEHIPKKKRISLASNVNDDPDIYKAGQETEEHLELVQQSFFSSLIDGVSEGVSAGAELVVEAVSYVADKVVNFAKSSASWITRKLFSLF